MRDRFRCAIGHRDARDGFRFDLGTILARAVPHVSDAGRGPGQLPAGSDSVQSEADPRAVGHRPRRLPRSSTISPPTWLGRVETISTAYVRAYWKGDEGKVPELATRLTGVRRSVQRRRAQPWASGDFITPTTGSLCTTRSYNDNTTRQTGKTIATGIDNQSWKRVQKGGRMTGTSGRWRERQKRNFLATLVFSQGTRCCSGDEFATRNMATTNAYCQDNETSRGSTGMTQRR